MSITVSDLYKQHLTYLRSEYGRAIETAGFAGLIVHSGAARKQNEFDDQYWPLRPTPAFTHWLPLPEAECALVIVPGADPVVYRPSEASYWEGKATAESDHFWPEFRWVELPAERIADELRQTPRLAFVGESTEHARAFGLPDAAINPPGLLAALDGVRAIKSEYERACIAEANRRGARGHAAVARAFIAADASELDLHLLYLRATSQDDAETPYKNIVAIGKHAAVLHHVLYDRQLASAGSLLVDAGATCCGYASDITRTMVKPDGDRAASDRFGALVAGVERLQQEVTRRVAPGLSFESLHDQAHQLLAGVLREVGIADPGASEEALVGTGVTRAFLPHGLGHSLGIQVHDVGCRTQPPRGDNPYLRNTSDITVGHVFTIEPGCYFIDSLLARLQAEPGGRLVDWTVVDQLRPFGGVRIEDNIAVVDGGTRNLTRDNWPA